MRDDIFVLNERRHAAEVDFITAEYLHDIANAAVQIIARERPPHLLLRIISQNIVIVEQRELATPQIKSASDLTCPAHHQARQSCSTAVSNQIALGVFIGNISARFQDCHGDPELFQRHGESQSHRA